MLVDICPHFAFIKECNIVVIFQAMPLHYSRIRRVTSLLFSVEITQCPAKTVDIDSFIIYLFSTSLYYSEDLRGPLNHAGTRPVRPRA